jgi:hypothetical protein
MFGSHMMSLIGANILLQNVQRNLQHSNSKYENNFPVSQICAPHLILLDLVKISSFTSQYNSYSLGLMQLNLCIQSSLPVSIMLNYGNLLSNKYSIYMRE